MLDLYYRACSEPHQLLWRVHESDPHGKALCDVYPIQRSLDVWNGARQIDALLVQYTPPDPLDGALDCQPSIDHGVGGYAIADRNGTQLRLPKVGDGVPGFRIDESKQR